MKRYSYPARLLILAGILLSTAITVFPGPEHKLLFVLAVSLMIAGLVLLYLRRTGKTTWNGPQWGRKLRTSPKYRRVLILLPVLFASLIPILFLLQHRLGMSDGQFAMSSGVLVGMSLSMLAVRSNGRFCCEPDAIADTGVRNVE